MTAASSTAPGARRYDLDWLRVIAFAILIFYHIGMFYVTWDWHVKSPYRGAAAELPMMFVNPWRLALLFFISGIVVRYAMDRYASSGARLARFAWKRFWRLFVPIAFGMAVIVMPQAYFQLRYEGVIEPGLLAFWPQYFSFDDHFGIVTPTWNHLWYVVYLLVYTMIAIAAAPLLRPLADRFAGMNAKAGLILIALTPLPFLFYRFALEPHFPETHALVDDWANHAHRFTIFLLGFMIAKNDGFWRAVDRAAPAALGYIVLSVPLFAMAWFGDNWTKVDAIGLADLLRSMRIVYAWAVIVALCAFARRRLNHDSPTLRYLTNAVFCYYILHQTITVAAGYELATLGLPWPLEFFLLTAATVGGCAVGYEVFRRIPYLRFALGIEEKKTAPRPKARLLQGASAVEPV
ncbi:MAG: acyltransferase family protein [Parvularculaceae bacterium]